MCFQNSKPSNTKNHISKRKSKLCLPPKNVGYKYVI